MRYAGVYVRPCKAHLRVQTKGSLESAATVMEIWLSMPRISFDLRVTAPCFPNTDTPKPAPLQLAKAPAPDWGRTSHSLERSRVLKAKHAARRGAGVFFLVLELL